MNEMKKNDDRSRKYRFAVIDDTEDDLRNMKDLLLECFPESCIDTFINSESFIKENSHYSMVVLDVHLEAENGLHATRRIQEYTSCILFFTAYPTELVSAISYKVIGFLRKTDNREFLKEKLLEAEKEYLTDLLLVETSVGEFSISRHKISMVGTENRKLYFHMDRGQKLQVMNLRLMDVPEVLGKTFIQINKSEYVNTEHIRIFDQNRLVLINDMEVFVSRRKEKEVKKAYFRRLL